MHNFLKLQKSKVEDIFMNDKTFYGKFKYFLSILEPEADFLTITYIWVFLTYHILR